MRYQLVIQFPGDSLTDYDRLVSVEARLTAALADVAEVDGHDVGSGEANIFVLTEDPTGAFALALPVLKECVAIGGMRAAFRDVGGEAYTVIWPQQFRGTFALA